MINPRGDYAASLINTLRPVSLMALMIVSGFSFSLQQDASK